MSLSSSPERWPDFLTQARQKLQTSESTLELGGTLTRLTGLVLEAQGLRVPVGSQCLVSMKSGAPVLAEVVGFSNERALS